MNGRKILAMCMCIILVVSMASTYAGAKESQVQEQVGEEQVVHIEDEFIETIKEPFSAPDIIEQEEVAERGYVGRVKEEEKDLYTFVFEHEGGERTMRMFSHPVKYRTAEGEVRDISLVLKKSDKGGYVSADHEITTRFENLYEDGISLEYGDIRIVMKPDMDKETMSVAASQRVDELTPCVDADSRTVRYEVSDHTAFEYELTYTGFKEDIVVEEYTGQTEYTFTLYTNGLFVSEEYGDYFLVDKAGEIKATIGDIIIFTADQRNNTMGSMTYETVRVGKEYRMTIHVDAAYLAEEATVYPIRIDPTIEVNYDNDGAGAIEDVTIGSVSNSAGTSGSLYIGLRSATGISRTLMRFPNLDLSSFAAADYINHAQVELRDLMCESTAMTVYCYVFTGNAWTESTATWSSVSPNNIGTSLSNLSISYDKGASLSTPHRYAFNITKAVQGWKSGTYNQSKGIIFKASDSVETGSNYTYKTMASYNRSSYKPSLTVYYTIPTESERYIIFQGDGDMMLSSLTGVLGKGTYSASSTAQKWVFTEVREGVYNIRLKANMNKCLTAVASTSTVKVATVEKGNPNQNWSVVATGQGCKIVCESSATAIAGAYLYYTGGTYTLNSTNYTLFGMQTVSGLVYPTSMTISTIELDEGDTKYIYPTYSPGASFGTGAWCTYSSSNTSIFTVSTDGIVTARGCGSATLTVTNKISNLSATALVWVNDPPNPDGQNKTEWCWAASSKMVAEHNGKSDLADGYEQPLYSTGLHSYDDKPFYGHTPDGRYLIDSGQLDIVYFIYKEEINAGGTLRNIEQSLQYATVNDMSIGTRSAVAYEELLKSELAEGRWVVGNLWEYNSIYDSSKDRVGHAIVVRAYNTTAGEFTCWDPWSDEEFVVAGTRLIGGTFTIIEGTERIEYVMTSFQYCY